MIINLDNQEDLARIQEFILKSNFAAPIEGSVHKILYEATFYKDLDLHSVEKDIRTYKFSWSTVHNYVKEKRNIHMNTDQAPHYTKFFYKKSRERVEAQIS